MKSFKLLTTLVFTGILFLINVGNASAFSYYTAESQKLDKSLSEDSTTQYVNPRKIYITQVTTASGDLVRDPSKWVKTLYYYCITRLHLSNVPYTYLLDENGIIYQGNTGGVGANPELREIDGAIVIGYLSNTSSLSTRSSESLFQVVDELSENWGISELEVVNMYINEEEGKLSSISTEISSGDFRNAVKEVFKDWEGYSEEKLPYKVKIEEVVYEDEVEIGNRLNVKLKIKNLNDFIWFSDKDPIYITVKDSKESSFAINQEWLSFSKPVSISDKNILPGESVELEFNLEARVLLGEAEENFQILKFEGEPFLDSDFNVKFGISRGEKQLVEVASPRYSFVNIRDCRWYSCKTLDSADNGTVFILEEEEEGWSKIRYGVDLYGWINSAYLKKL